MLQPFLVENLEAIAELCRTHYVLRLAVFGSAVRDDFDPARSDVDFLVEFAVPDGVRRAANLLDLRARLERLLDRRVDLVVDGTIENPYILETIREDEQDLYAA